MEGPTFGLRYGLDIFKDSGIEPDEIRLVGGGAKSKIWREIVADIFACPVVCPVTQEAAALGAALQALWCYLNIKENKADLKEITDQFVTLDEATRVIPNRERMDIYSDIYKKYLSLDKILRPIYNEYE
jgi:xylulokinase